MKGELTPAERVFTALSYREPDKVPLLFFFSFYPAKELKISIKEYFSNPDAVVEGQLYMLKKYRGDCLYTLHYGCIELEGVGVEPKWKEWGPPVANNIVIRSREDIKKLKFPPVKETRGLRNVLYVTEKLRKEVGDKVPIIGGIVSPFCLPIMQMGFDRYLDLIYSDREAFWELMEKNIAFSIEWANSQLEAGATAIGYGEPLASTDILDRKTYLETGYIVAQRTIPKIGGAVAIGFAGARAGGAVDYFREFSNVGGVGVSALEDIGEVKEKVKGRFAVVGNLNGVEMIDWSREVAEEKVKEIIKKAAKGGGFAIADNHGEIPYFVSEETLLSIREAVDRWGRYPINI